MRRGSQRSSNPDSSTKRLEPTLMVRNLGVEYSTHDSIVRQGEHFSQKGASKFGSRRVSRPGYEVQAFDLPPRDKLRKKTEIRCQISVHKDVHVCKSRLPSVAKCSSSAKLGIVVN